MKDKYLFQETLENFPESSRNLKVVRHVLRPYVSSSVETTTERASRLAGAPFETHANIHKLGQRYLRFRLIDTHVSSILHMLNLLETKNHPIQDAESIFI